MLRVTSRFVATLSLALAIPVYCAAQAGGTPAPVNPRAASNDPRIGLKPGLYDAGEAASGLERLASLPKPPGFAPGTGGATEPFPPPQAPDAGKEQQPRTVQYGSANSDLAFNGNHLFVGNYNGINFYDIDNPAKTALKTSLVCPGGQGDVSVYGHLLFMSAEAMNGRTDCGIQGIALPEGYKPPAASAACSPRRASDAASPSSSQPRSFPRRPYLRHQRPRQSQAGGRRPELPRIAHPHAGDRSQR